MYKIAALVYKAKFEWRKVFKDIFAGKKPKIHLVDDGINIWTALFNMPAPWKFKEWKEWIRGSYSHIELWISDKNGYFKNLVCRKGYGVDGELALDDKKMEYLGHCYTSTMRDGMAGTVLRPAREVLKHPARWDVGVIGEIEQDDYDCGMTYVNKKVRNNKGYDKLCIADFFNPVRWWLPLHSKLKDICSEAFQGGLYVFMMIIVSKYICSPRRIVRILKKRGVKFIPVTKM